MFSVKVNHCNIILLAKKKIPNEKIINLKFFFRLHCADYVCFYTMPNFQNSHLYPVYNTSLEYIERGM